MIREIADGDFNDLYAYWSLPKAWKYAVLGPNSKVETKNFVKYAQAENRKKPREQYRFAIVLLDTGHLIGDCNIIISNPTDHEAHIGYALHPDFWNQGFTTEAVKELIRFGFKQLKLHRIFATCDTKNLASKRVLEKSGMRYEGTFRKDKFQKGRWRDTHQFAVINSQ